MKSLLMFSVLLCWSFSATGQNGTIKGAITDSDGEPLIGASIMVQETSTGELTDLNGLYSITIAPGAYNIIAKYVGYADKTSSLLVVSNETVTLDFSLSIGTLMDEVVVSASKSREKLTESPATIVTIFARQIEEYAGNPGELIARQKGVDYFRAGIATPAFNIRGFNSNFNAKNLQVTDGRFSTLVATGLPFGPLNTTVKEDIERVEVILGPNATLYGPNAHNGLLNIITKDPRTSAGTTVALSPGVSGDGDAYYSARLRHAQVVNDKFAFKVTGEYTAGTEFEYTDSVFIDRVGAFDTLGNAIPNGIKEGYEEYDLDRDVKFIKAEAGLFYTPTDDLEINLNVGHSNSTYLAPTNVGRNQIKDWKINYYQLKLSGNNWSVQGYYTQSKTDSTYSIDERTKQYYKGIGAGMSSTEAGGDFSYSSGSLFKDNSHRWNAEGQYNNTFGKLGVIAGVQYQLDKANSLGTYLLDKDENDFISIGQYGAYAHLTYDFGKGWKSLAAARLDNHDNYGQNFVPKFGLLKIGDQGTWRLTYGQGIAAPTILNLYGDLFNGLILGNAEGFTLVDGTQLDRQRVEKIQTIELGYRGQVVKNKLFIDANAYYNISKDFLSPVTVVFAAERAGVPLRDVQNAGLYDFYKSIGLEGLVATYINFGEVNTYGFDLGGTYYFNSELSMNANYSYFTYSVDEQNLENDFNGDGIVNFLDILVNAPTHKIGAGLDYSGKKWFGSVFGRWAQAYDYFSSFQIASKTHEDLVYRGLPIVEGARSGDSFNYGPLGGFVTVDASIGYRINKKFTVSASASNLFNSALREFTASAPTKGLYTLEFKINLPALGKK